MTPLRQKMTEELVRRFRDKPAAKSKAVTNTDGDMTGLEEDLRQALGTKVLLARSRKGGRIVIEYYSDEEFSRLYDRLTGGNA